MKRLAVFLLALAASAVAFSFPYCPELAGTWTDNTNSGAGDGDGGRNGNKEPGSFVINHNATNGMVGTLTVPTISGGDLDCAVGSTFAITQATTPLNGVFAESGAYNGTPPVTCPSSVTWTITVPNGSVGCADATVSWSNNVSQAQCDSGTYTAGHCIGSSSWTGTCNLPGGGTSASEKTVFTGWAGGIANFAATVQPPASVPTGDVFDWGARTVDQQFSSYSDTCGTGGLLGAPFPQRDQVITPGYTNNTYTIGYLGNSGSLSSGAVLTLVRSLGHAPCTRTFTEKMYLDCPTAQGGNTNYRVSTITQYINPDTVEWKRVAANGTDSQTSTAIKLGPAQEAFGYLYADLVPFLILHH
jgi:hypothetical protein